MFSFLTKQAKMPGLEELTRRYESACQRIQDQLYVIESHMAGHESFTFHCSEEISNLHQVDLAVKRSIVTSYIYVPWKNLKN